MSEERQQLEAAISALEAQRSVLGDSVVDASIGALREELAALARENANDPAQTLKQVTILFLDVVGSTAPGQHLDPEAIGDVMDGALYRLSALVEKHGGKVLKYAGDSILAVFGADEAREDDADPGRSLASLSRRAAARRPALCRLHCASSSSSVRKAIPPTWKS